MNQRKQRGKRPSSRAAVALTPRDRDVLILLARTRYASIENLVEAGLFGSVQRARHRARAWFDAGWVDVHIMASNVSACISLTTAGIAIVRGADPELAVGLRPPSALKLVAAEHHLAIVSARLYARAVGDELGATLLEWSNAGGDSAAALGLRRLRLDPDGLARYASSTAAATEGEFFVAVEADLGHEDVPGAIAAKLEKYQLPIATGLIRELWLVASGGPVRLLHLMRAVQDAGLARSTRVIPLGHVRGRPVQPLPPIVAAVAAGSGGKASLNSLRVAFHTDRKRKE